MTTEDGSTPAHADVLVRNAYVVTMDSQRRVYPSGAVAITGATIAAVGPDRDVAPAFTATRTISTRGALVHPGFGRQPHPPLPPQHALGVRRVWGPVGPLRPELLGSVRGRDGAEDVLTMAAISGARAVGLSDRIGSLEVGKRADLVVRREDLPEAQPGRDPVRSMVHSTRSKSVDTVKVDGKVIVEHGHSTRVDEERSTPGPARPLVGS